MWRFEYYEPKSISELMEFLAKYGKRAAVLAGGTDLVPKLTRRTARPSYVVNLKKIPGLNKLSYSKTSGLRIGALVTMREIETNELIASYYPVLAEAAHTVGSVQVRNIATLVGNICNGSPSADSVPSLLSLNASVRVVSGEGSRLIPLDSFFVGPFKTILKGSEVVTELVIPPLKDKTGCSYFKHTIRKAMDMALVGVAVRLTLDSKNELVREARIGLGAVGPTPIRARRAEEVLVGKRVTEELLEKAGEVAAKEAKPRSYPEYKREMVAEFTLRAGRRALERATGG